MSFLPKHFFYVFVLLIVLSACAVNNAKTMCGTLTMGHEVRQFVPDGQEKEYWVIDKSDKLYKKYQEIAPVESGLYTPVRAELKVIELPKMQDGFGTEYDGTYDVVEIISLTPIKK